MPLERFQFCRCFGESIARLHNEGIIHGDLTTSNAMIEDGGDRRLILIDFGLSTFGGRAHTDEDKAVDVYVLERAFVSTHPDAEDLIAPLLDGYLTHVNGRESVQRKLDEVRSRGRKRSMVG